MTCMLCLLFLDARKGPQLIIASFSLDDSWTLFPFLPHSCSLTCLEPHTVCKDNLGIAVCMLSSLVAVATEKVWQHHVILDWPSCFNTNCHSKIGNLSTVKAGYCFEQKCIDEQVEQTLRPLVGPSLSECTCTMLTFVFEFELCTSRASIGPAPVQFSKKSGSRMSLTFKKSYTCPQ